MRHTQSVQEDDFAELPRAIERLGDGYDSDQRDRLMRAAGYAWPGRNAIPNIPSPFVVAERLKTLGTDSDTVVAALLGSPACEETLPLDKVAGEFGDVVAGLVQNVRWLNSFREAEDAKSDEELRAPEQAERLRRMVLSMVKDVRAVLIKLAYRTQRLHTITGDDYDSRRRIARETLDLYAPLANRLGIAQLKWEMEDLAFRYLEPQAYKHIAKSLEERREDRERYVRQFVETLRTKLAEAGLEQCDIFGRPKHIYSIWKKMQRKRVEFSELFDVRAVRVLVGSLPECYAALGAVHSTWQHIPKEFDDYVANPKENGYQSLHTAVIGPEGKPVEVQIRTRQMDEDAELGVAAHWRYKEGGDHDDRLQRSINSLRTLLDGEGEDDDDLMASFQGEMFSDRVFVLTPKGKILDLPLSATPLDFAYQVHTQIGHRCRGAKVNGAIVPLNYSLKNGETVEILTTKEPKPSRDWLNRDLGYLASARSRAKVRHWFNIRDHEQHVEDGKVILERELKRHHALELPLEKLVQQLKFERGSDLFAAIGRNDVNTAQIAAAVYALERPAEDIPRFRPRKSRKPAQPGAEEVSVRGVGNLLTTIATCCQPVPYDDIVGFITRGKGVTVHRQDCPNILNLDDERRERLIDVAWGEEHGAYPVDLRVLAFDRHGLIRDVSAIMANDDLNVTRMHTETDPQDQTVDMRLTVEIESVEQLSRVMEKLRQLSNVLEVERRGQDAI